MIKENESAFSPLNSERPEIISFGSSVLPIPLTRRGEDEAPILVNWSKFATLEPIVEYDETHPGAYAAWEPVRNIVGSSIMLDCGISFEVKETPEEIGKIVREIYLPKLKE